MEAHLWPMPILGRPERAVRDECLRALVPGVLELGASRIVVESCSQDRLDERVIGSAVAAAGLIGTVDYRVVPGHSDELLWAADLVTWAYMAGGRDQQAISGLITLHELP